MSKYEGHSLLRCKCGCMCTVGYKQDRNIFVVMCSKKDCDNSEILEGTDFDKLREDWNKLAVVNKEKDSFKQL